MQRNIQLTICLMLTALASCHASLFAKDGPEQKEPANRPATVLLITSNDLSDAWKPFASWKTRLGKSTRIVTVEEIDAQYEGDDIQQKIRVCCLESIEENGTRWVILGGDSRGGQSGGVPDRDTDHSGYFRYKDIPTDIYYISETDWDANQDGIYGEWPKDKEAVSYVNRKATIGRIPVRTSEDVVAYTEKIIEYESQYPEHRFAHNMVYVCPIRHAQPKLKTSQETLQPLWKSGKIERFYDGETPWDNKQPGDHDLSPENFVELINGKQTAKMHVHGHGYLPVWVLEGHKMVGKQHVDKLKNDKAYLAMTTVSCFTGQFDARQDPSITEAMIRKPNGGAVLIIAPAREGVPVFHNPRTDMRLMITQGKMDGTTITMTRFWKHALNGNLTAGEAFRAAKEEMIEDAKKSAGYHWVQCELNLLGDPTLDLRATDPRSPQLNIPETLSTGQHELTFKTGIPGATICLWKENECYVVVQADEKGIATTKCKWETPGKLLVTASGPSLNASLGEIAIE